MEFMNETIPNAKNCLDHFGCMDVAASEIGLQSPLIVYTYLLTNVHRVPFYMELSIPRIHRIALGIYKHD